jgi:hypothetical protein
MTTQFACADPKLSPDTATELPTLPDVGLKILITGFAGSASSLLQENRKSKIETAVDTNIFISTRVM